MRFYELCMKSPINEAAAIHNLICENSGSHSGEYEVQSVLGCSLLPCSQIHVRTASIIRAMSDRPDHEGSIHF
jgi:hypothetical protein